MSVKFTFTPQVSFTDFDSPCRLLEPREFLSSFLNATLLNISSIDHKPIFFNF